MNISLLSNLTHFIAPSFIFFHCQAPNSSVQGPVSPQRTHHHSKSETTKDFSRRHVPEKCHSTNTSITDMDATQSTTYVDVSTDLSLSAPAYSPSTNGCPVSSPSPPAPSEPLLQPPLGRLPETSEEFEEDSQEQGLSQKLSQKPPMEQRQPQYTEVSFLNDSGFNMNNMSGLDADELNDSQLYLNESHQLNDSQLYLNESQQLNTVQEEEDSEHMEEGEEEDSSKLQPDEDDLGYEDMPSKDDKSQNSRQTRRLSTGTTTTTMMMMRPQTMPHQRRRLSMEYMPQRLMHTEHNNCNMSRMRMSRRSSNNNGMPIMPRQGRRFSNHGVRRMNMERSNHIAANTTSNRPALASIRRPLHGTTLKRENSWFVLGFDSSSSHHPVNGNSGGGGNNYRNSLTRSNSDRSIGMDSWAGLTVGASTVCSGKSTTDDSWSCMENSFATCSTKMSCLGYDTTTEALEEEEEDELLLMKDGSQRSIVDVTPETMTSEPKAD